MPSADLTHALSSSSTKSKSKPKRILACVLCQQRKVKCDRKFPCANCRRSGAQCVSTATPHPRRRRFAERELLDRLRQFEGLLRQNNVDFKPLHQPDSHGGQGEDAMRQNGAEHVASAREMAVDTAGQTEPVVEFLHVIKKMTMDPEDEIEDNLNTRVENEKDPHLITATGDGPESRDLTGDAWQYPSHVNKDNHNGRFLFGTPQENIDLSSLHPDQAQILRLWQIYLENVDPLLKCTHSPTLQARIIDALGHLADNSPLLNALMFSIYCVSVMSIDDEDCNVRFGTSRQHLLAEYHSACQQALLNCKAWRSGEIDVLTALYLYLISLRPQTDPRSISAILAIVIRNAQRMGLHDEMINAKHTVLEAEMRRRLWWSLVAFDHRICELVEYKVSSLTPLWDCRLPLNVNDFEVRSQMKSPPVDHERPTEALFPFVWSQLANSLRHSSFHLNFINPALNALRQPAPSSSVGDDAEFHEAVIEKHLACCEPDNPLNFMTIWMVRGQLARHHLLAYYARHYKKSVLQTDSQRRAALSHALGMLECDTKLKASPLTKRYLWFTNFHFPAVAYFHIINHTKKQPNKRGTEDAWRVMRDNWNARAANREAERKGKRKEQMTFEGFVKNVENGWEAFGAALRRDMEDEMLEKEDLLAAGPSKSFSATEPTQPGCQLMPEDNFHELETGLSPDVVSPSIMGGEMAHFWTAMDWRFMDPQGW